MPAHLLQQGESTAHVSLAAKEAADEEKVQHVVQKMNQAVQAFSQSLRFEMTKTNRIVVRVVDTNSGEVLRQFPTEELLSTYERMEEAIGVLLDRRV